jgi:hypothetical protein
MSEQLKLMKWIYWDNSKIWHGQQLFEVVAYTITEADSAFEKAIGIHPSKVSAYSVQQNLLE